MENKGLQHDVAWAIAYSVVADVFAPLLRDEEKTDAVREVYTRVLSGIEALEIQQNRLEQRMTPSKN